MRQYFVFCGHSDRVVLPGGGVAEALSRGHGGVSHSGRGDQNAQVLNGAPQTVRLHLKKDRGLRSYDSAGGQMARYNVVRGDVT